MKKKRFFRHEKYFLNSKKPVLFLTLSHFEYPRYDLCIIKFTYLFN
jgi:hypothetical protein